MGSIRIRLAEGSDNDQITALAKRCYQEGMITFFVNRTPRFNTLHRLLDPKSWHYVVEDGDTIVGLVGVIHFEAMLLGKPKKFAYMMDFRIDEQYRKGLTAFRMVKKAIDHVLSSDTDFVIGNFLKANQNSLVFASGRAGIPEGLHLGDNRIFNLLPIRKLKTDPRYDISPLSMKDFPELQNVFLNHAKNFRFTPIITAEILRGYFNRLENLSPEDFLVARENGQIRAATAMWDEKLYKSYQVLKLTPTIRFVNGALKLLSPFFKVPQPIHLNEPLKQLSLVLYAHDNCPEALQSLFRHVNNIQRGSDYTLITIYACESDPVFDLMNSFTGVSVQTELYLYAKDTSIYEEIKKDKRPDRLPLALKV